MTQDKPADPKQQAAAPRAAKAASGGAPAAGPGLLIDPLELWRKALTEFEQRANELGNQSMRSPEIVQLMHQLSTYSSQYQNVLDQVLTRGLKALNLPSRRDITELGDLMRQIDAKLDRLLPAAEPVAVPRPARTRRPSSELEASAAAPSAAAAPTPAEAGAAPAAEAGPAAGAAPAERTAAAEDATSAEGAAGAAAEVAEAGEAAPAEEPPRRRAARSRASAPGSRAPRKSRKQE